MDGTSLVEISGLAFQGSITNQKIFQYVCELGWTPFEAMSMGVYPEVYQSIYLDRQSWMRKRRHLASRAGVVGPRNVSLDARLKSAVVSCMIASSPKILRRDVFSHLTWDIQDLKKHLERQFTAKMTWDNWGGVWQIDHIIPRASLKKAGPESPMFSIVWALENHRPLCAFANRKKGARWLGQN